MATLKDVAAATGVHYTVVSSILNGAKGNSRYSAATREAVEATAVRLGYTRNEHASGLRGRSTRTVGLVAGNICNPFFAALTTALERQLHSAGYSLLLAAHDMDARCDEETLIRSLLSKSVEAVLIWSEGPAQIEPRALRRFGRPIIYLGTAHAGEWSVEVDIERGLRLAVCDLVARGHRRVVWFGPWRSLEIGLPQPRAAIFQRVTAGTLERALISTYDGASWDVLAATAGARGALVVAAAERATAVIGYNDVAALGWLMAQNMSSGVEVVGFDGTDWIRAWRPGVRYVDMRINAVAGAAVKLAVQAMAARPGKPQRIVVEPSYMGGTITSG